MSENIYPCPSSPRIILKVRSAMGPGSYLVGRWDCERNCWARPVKFAPIPLYGTPEEAQRALDRWAHLRGVKAVEEIGVRSQESGDGTVKQETA